MNNTNNGDMSVLNLMKLLGTAVMEKKEEYELTFVKDDDTWYIDLPNWPWKRENLAMVCGADIVLDLLANSPQNDKGPNKVKLLAKPTDEPVDNETLARIIKDEWFELTQVDSGLTKGAHYTAKGNALENFQRKDLRTGEIKPRTLWLCPVTLFVVGHYPKYFYGKVIK